MEMIKETAKVVYIPSEISITKRKEAVKKL
ncbi:unknown [Eubacterium sp. CAG:146]|nr:unknown [Eubacterium sp. CAG:146]